jgi:hypothetical protein
MNIFALDRSAPIAAKYHCDKHVVKMIVETAQMLCTAHRVLDGVMTVKMVGGRRKKVWTMNDLYLDALLYKATHVNHPSNIWARETQMNYEWLYELFCELCNEYTHRYGKLHKTDRILRDVLKTPPRKISNQSSMTEFALAMKSNPECMDPQNPIDSYRKFYRTKQSRFQMKWTKRQIPAWFIMSSI